MSKVRLSCQEVVKSAAHVSINHEALNTFLVVYKEPSPWSSFPCHYTGPHILDYIFALDSLNFCFWPHASFDYQDLALNLKTILDSNPQGLSPQTLSQFTLEDLTKIFPSDFYNLQTRLEKLHELGRITSQYFAGDYLNLLNTCKKSALKVLDI